jgi:hypothetical protein
MNLRKKFLLNHTTNHPLTTKEIIDWYQKVKKGSEHFQYSTVYQLIINPLIKENKLIKLDRGVYQINPSPSLSPSKREREMEMNYDLEVLTNDVNDPLNLDDYFSSKSYNI